MFFLKTIIRARSSMQQQRAEEPCEMSFVEHLEDLRRTLIRMCLALLVAMVACFAFTPSMLELLRLPVQGVWMSHERAHLPGSIAPQEWMQAKELESVRGSLTPEAWQLLQAHYPDSVHKLVQVLPLLRAARMLPVAEQAGYLKQAAGGEAEAELLERLHAAGADPEAGMGASTQQMMGAFQPGEAFMLSLQLAFFGGVVLSSPLLLYFLLQFVMPGLLPHERRIVCRSLWWGVGLFLLGCGFAYYAVLPRVLAFFFEYSWSMGISNDWRIGYYISFAAKLIFVFGIIFELPVVMVPLIRLGILTYDRMRRMRSYALVGSFVAALFLAPAPDPGTMFLMALPLYMLYEFCVLVAWRQARRVYPA